MCTVDTHVTARLAQSVERQTLNLVVVGSSPTVGVFLLLFTKSANQLYFLPVYRIRFKFKAVMRLEIKKEIFYFYFF